MSARLDPTPAFRCRPRSATPLLAGLLLLLPTLAFAADAFLGVHLQELDPPLREALDLGRAEEGVLVSEVVEGSPAEKAGLQRGDVVLTFDGRPVRTARALTRRVRAAEPGEKVAIEVLRKGKKLELDAQLGEAEGEFSVSEAPDVFFFDSEEGERPLRMAMRHFGGGQLGVRTEDLDETLGRYFSAKSGVLVLEVIEDSAAEKAGIARGDVIVEVGGEEVADRGTLVELLSEREAGDEVDVVVLRDEKRRTLKVELEEATARFGWNGRPGARVFTFPDGMHHGPQAAPRVLRRHLQERRGELHEEMRRLREELEALRERVEERGGDR